MAARKTSILLVNPNLVDEHELLGRSRGFSLVLNRIPCLGLGHLAAVVKASHRTIRIFDPIKPRSVSALQEVVAEERPDVIGFYSTTLYMRAIKRAVSLIERIADWNPLIILGGPQVSSTPEEAMEYTRADVGVIGEGERTLVELLERFEAGDEEFDGLAGTIVKKNGELRRNPPRPRIENLDSLPYPAWELMPPFRSWRPTPASYRRLPLAVIVASRGCPYRCAFCDQAVFGHSYRARSGESLFEEVKFLIGKHGIKEVRFFDDTFTENRKRVEEFCDLMLKSDVAVLWTCLATTRSADEGLLKLMKEAGCWQVLFGLESASDDTLRRLRKPQTVEQITQAVANAKRAGLSVRADFIVGLPGETLEEMRATVEFAKRLDVDFAHFNRFTPLPGTELHRELVSRGYRFDFDQNWSDLDHSNPLYVPEGVSPEEFAAFLDSAYKSFYLRPGYAIKKLLAIKTWTELKGHMKGLLSMIAL